MFFILLYFPSTFHFMINCFLSSPSYFQLFQTFQPTEELLSFDTWSHPHFSHLLVCIHAVFNFSATRKLLFVTFSPCLTPLLLFLLFLNVSGSLFPSCSLLLVITHTISKNRWSTVGFMILYVLQPNWSLHTILSHSLIDRFIIYLTDSQWQLSLRKPWKSLLRQKWTCLGLKKKQCLGFSACFYSSNQIIASFHRGLSALSGLSGWLIIFFSQFVSHRPDIKPFSSPPSFHIFLYSSFLHSAWWPSLPPPSVFFSCSCSLWFHSSLQTTTSSAAQLYQPTPKIFSSSSSILHHSSCKILMMLVGINQSL